MWRGSSAFISTWKRFFVCVGLDALMYEAFGVHPDGVSDENAAQNNQGRKIPHYYLFTIIICPLSIFYKCLQRLFFLKVFLRLYIFLFCLTFIRLPSFVI